MNKKIIVSITLLAIISLACSAPTPSAVTPTPIVITATSLPITDTPVYTDTPVFTPTFTVSPTLHISETPTLTPTLGAAMISPNTATNVNCRFGPSMDYLTTGALIVGESVPIFGKLADQSWWQINSNFNPGQKCWVSAGVTTVSGNISLVPLKSAPAAQVIEVSITAPDTIHGHCGGPNPTSFEASIKTNGPASVDYHLSVYNGDGTLRSETATETRSFASAGTQTFDPGGVYKTDCGDFYAKIVVTAPNSISDQVNWSVVEP